MAFNEDFAFYYRFHLCSRTWGLVWHGSYRQGVSYLWRYGVGCAVGYISIIFCGLRRDLCHNTYNRMPQVVDIDCVPTL